MTLVIILLSQIAPPEPEAVLAIRNDSESRVVAMLRTGERGKKGDWQTLDLLPGKGGRFVVDGGERQDLRIFRYAGKSVYEWGIQGVDFPAVAAAAGPEAEGMDLELQHLSTWKFSTPAGTIREVNRRPETSMLPLDVSRGRIELFVNESGGIGVRPTRPIIRP